MGPSPILARRAILVIFSTLLTFSGADSYGARLEARDLYRDCQTLLVAPLSAQHLAAVGALLNRYHQLSDIVDQSATADTVKPLSEQAHLAGAEFTILYNQHFLEGLGLSALPMRAFNIGESARRSVEFLIRNPGDSADIYPTVYYFSKSGLLERRLRIQRGRAYWPNGELVQDLKHSEYVLGLDGELYVLKATDTGDQFRHSSFFSGDPVAGAGTISFNTTGRIVSLTRSSGHYVPAGKALTVVVARLRQLGMYIAPEVIEWRRRVARP